MVKEAFNKCKELRSRNMSRRVKKKVVKTIVWTVAQYRCETWTLKKEKMKRLNALEMWI